MRLAVARLLAAVHRLVARANRLPLAIAAGLLRPSDQRVRQQRQWTTDAACYAEAERGLTGRAVTANAADFPFDGGPYAGIFFSWYVYSYICPRARRIVVLKRLAQALRDDGCVALVLASPRGPRGGPTLHGRRAQARLRSPA